MTNNPFVAGDQDFPVPLHPQDIDKRWIHHLLMRNGELTQGGVSSVTVTPAPRWHLAETAFVEVEYSGLRESVRWCRLFVKISHHRDPLSSVFPGEPAFYASNRDAGLPIPDCLDVVMDNRGRSCLVLEDLRPSHESLPWPDPPGEKQCNQAIDTLAQLHSSGRIDPASRTTALLDQLIQHERVLRDYFSPIVNRLLNVHSRAIRAEQAVVIECCVEQIPRIKSRRLTSGGSITRVHGDPHFWNFMYPRSNTGKCLLLDWEDWRIDLRGGDLAAMLLLHGDARWDSRQVFDKIDRYRQRFEAHSGTAVSRTGLIDELRIGHIQNLVIPLYQFHAGMPQEQVASTLSRWLDGFETMGCLQLLEV